MKKIVLFLLVLTCFSCKKGILDIDPLDRIGESVVWQDENLIKAYQTELYNAIPHGFGVHGMLSKHTDEAVNTTPSGQPPNLFARGTWNGDNITQLGNNDNQFIYYWDRGYQYIRKINILLEQLAANKVAITDKPKLIAETKFIRAYIYFLLLERFGGVPIVEQSYGLGADVKFKRATIDEVVNYIDKNLTEAIPDLPQKYAANDGSFGRATRDACLALRSRVFLYAASPLYVTAKDNLKWQKAADAAAALLNSGYSLYPDYRLAFNRKSGDANSELIFGRNFTTANGHQTPSNNLGRKYEGYGGWWASNGPSQNLVDDYDMTNGQPPFIVTGTGLAATKTINPLSGYDPTKPYLNRDPRFEATVIHDQTVFRGDLFEMWVAADGKTWGIDSYKQTSDNPRGNYQLKKYMPDADLPINWQTVYTTPWPFFRLAEIYLNYAEAKFELGDEATAREYVNKVRARPSVNMPPIPATVTGEALRQRIYNERRVELAFEAHRFWDLRRWKIAIDIENRPVYGMDVIKAPDGTKTYTPVKMIERKYEEKMNWIPIETNELRRNPDITSAPW